MERRIRYCTPYRAELRDFLFHNGIPFERTEEGMRASGYDWLTFTISDHYERFREYVEFLQAFQHVSVLSDVLFTEKERSEAAWLTCSATSAKVELEREEETFRLEERYEGGAKARHRSLCGKPFYVSRPVRHTAAQHFFCSDSASEYHLFCDDRAKKLLSQFSGAVEFREVLHARTEQPMADLYYLEIRQSIDPAAIDLAGAPEQFICPVCGKKTFFPPAPPLSIQKEALLDMPAICKTEEIFSFGGNLAVPINLVKQEVYQLIVANKLGRGLRFDPVIVI